MKPTGIDLFERIRRRCISQPRQYVDFSIGSQCFVESDSEELLWLADRIAASLSQQNSCSSVVLWLDRCTTFIPSVWGCLAAGMTVFPLPISVSGRRPIEQDLQLIIDLFRNLGPTCVIIDETSSHARRWIPPELDIRWLNFSSIISSKAVLPSDHHAAQVAFVLQTSGTTKSSKYAAFSGQSFGFERTRNKRVLTLSPLGSSSGFPLIYALNDLSVYLPLSDAIQNPALLLESVQKYRLQEIGLPPVMLQRLLRFFSHCSSEYLVRSLSTLESLTIGTSTIPVGEVELLSTSLKQLGLQRIRIYLAYGTTETGGISCSLFREVSHHAHAQGVLIGPVNQDVQLRVISDNSQNSGPIEVRRPYPFLGYLKQGKAGNLFLDAFSSGNDWFKTGDLGSIQQGSLVLSGREKDIILVNSRKISLESIEQFVRLSWNGIWPDHLNVAVACAAPDEQLVLFLVLDNCVPAGDYVLYLQKYIAEQLQLRFGVCASQFVLLKDDAVPRSEIGKVKKWILLDGWLKQRSSPQCQDVSSSILDVDPILNVLCSEISQRVCQPSFGLAAQRISTLGLDSLALAEVIGRVERETECCCALDLIPVDPSLTDLAALFSATKFRHSSTSSRSGVSASVDLQVYPQRELLIKRMMTANLTLSGGEKVGSHQLLRCFNQTGDADPYIFFGSFSKTSVQEIADACPRNPIYVAQAPVIYDGQFNNAYLACCYVDWIEPILNGRHPILVGFCLPGVLALEVSSQFWHRRHPARCTLLMDWCIGAFRSKQPYLGACIYHISARWLKNNLDNKSSIEKEITALTPNTPLLMWSPDCPHQFGDDFYQRDAARCFLRLQEYLGKEGFLRYPYRET